MFSPAAVYRLSVFRRSFLSCMTTMYQKSYGFQTGVDRVEYGLLHQHPQGAGPGGSYWGGFDDSYLLSDFLEMTDRAALALAGSQHGRSPDPVQFNVCDHGGPAGVVLPPAVRPPAGVKEDSLAQSRCCFLFHAGRDLPCGMAGSRRIQAPEMQRKTSVTIRWGAPSWPGPFLYVPVRCSRYL